MSAVAIRAALETALIGITPTLATAWENAPFTPTTGTAYQHVFLKGVTDNPTLGGNHYRVNGYMQVNLCYPLQTGSSAASTRAELIKTTFKRGYSFTSGGVTVIIDKTPDGMEGGRVDGDRFVIPVKIFFFCDIQ